MTKKERRNRLLRFARYIAKLKPRSFDMDTWLEHKNDEPEIERDQIHALKDLKTGHCGTAGCLAGHAVSFFYNTDRRKLKYDKRFDYEEMKKSRAINFPESGRRLLGLEKEEAYMLFHDFDLKTPKQAAKRLLELAEK